jgi:hypothetical protein
MAEVVLLLAVLVLPLLAGAAARYSGRPWWWGAAVTGLVVLVAAIAPEPEEGESRLVAGDLIFLLIVIAIASGLAWLGAWLVGRLSRAS